MLGIKPAAPAPSIYSDPFPDELWLRELRMRELLDGLLTTTRWKLTIVPADGRVRRYWLTGSHAQVTLRAHSFFPNGSVLIEPSPIPFGAEVIDARLSLSHTGD